MGVLLQGFYKVQPRNAVPAPVDGDADIPWWWDHLAAQANDLRLAGFSAIWLPPVLKAAAGAGPHADGYGPFDDYDIGSKNQMGQVATRFGTREALQRCVAVFRANGIDVYVDLVEHHRSGDPANSVFRYKGADDVPDIGRFPKDPLNFLPNVPRDPNLGGLPKDDSPFGRELAPINAKPTDYVSTGLTDAADWMTRSLDLQGYRLDDVKGLSTDFLFPFLNAKAMAGRFAVGEFFDGDRTAVNNWVVNPQGMRGRSNAFDFPLRFMLARMCRNPGSFNMADLDHAGLAGLSPGNAVTFVENHDTDLNDPIVTNKMLAYAYILTSEGYPCVYYRDYSTDRDCYGLKGTLDNLIWIHERFANGPTLQRWKDNDLFVYERLGAPGLLVALNNDPANDRTVEVATAFGPNVTLHDYSDHADNVTTTGTGTLVIRVPHNVDGAGYVCYGRAGVTGDFTATPQAVTRDFEGAADLDLPPADASRPIDVGRIWCAKDQPIALRLAMPTLDDPATVTMTIGRPDGLQLAQSTSAASAAHAMTTIARETGYHMLRIALAQAPSGLRPSYRLSATYTASPTLPALAPNGLRQEDIGKWDENAFPMQNVAVHAHLLPNGKVLFWGRRDKPDGTLNDHFCTPQVWDPRNGQTVPTPQPTDLLGATVNLFCSGHTLLPDGTLLVAGGHDRDGFGLTQTNLYDFSDNSWTPKTPMTNGRWYPCVVTLANGQAVVLSGSFGTSDGKNVQNNPTPQLWDGTTWHTLRDFPGAMELFPCLHVAPDGRIFMSGPGSQSWFFDPLGNVWNPLAGPGGVRSNARRDYAPSVMYDVGKILYIGGGNDPEPAGTPTNECEVIDLTAPSPAWRVTNPMNVPRRHHNATLLPDGTVLVTGGTRGAGFNNLGDGKPVHMAELWDPTTEKWKVLGAEDTDRCYHGTAILLPDATVLSAGSGEYDPKNNGTPNDPKDSHRNAQIYRPAYLFRGPRPEISAAPLEVSYGMLFDVGTPTPNDIAKVTWLRLSYTTHTDNMNQRINVLDFEVAQNGLRVTSPARAEICPPGHYMMFALNHAGVPSSAHILRIAPDDVAPPIQALAQAALAQEPPALTLEDIDRAVRDNATGTKATLGLTSKCPYGLGACWGGAYEALKTLDGVSAVRPIANAADSTADVYLGEDSLPDIDRWEDQIKVSANGSYILRGVELVVTGTVMARDGGLFLQGPDFSALSLRPLGGADKVQFDLAAGRPKPSLPDEMTAFDRLASGIPSTDVIEATRITGPMVRKDTSWALHVRSFAQ